MQPTVAVVALGLSDATWTQAAVSSRKSRRCNKGRQWKATLVEFLSLLSALHLCFHPHLGDVGESALAPLQGAFVRQALHSPYVLRVDGSFTPPYGLNHQRLLAGRPSRWAVDTSDSNWSNSSRSNRSNVTDVAMGTPPPDPPDDDDPFNAPDSPDDHYPNLNDYNHLPPIPPIHPNSRRRAGAVWEGNLRWCSINDDVAAVDWCQTCGFEFCAYHLRHWCRDSNYEALCHYCFAVWQWNQAGSSAGIRVPALVSDDHLRFQQTLMNDPASAPPRGAASSLGAASSALAPPQGAGQDGPRCVVGDGSGDDDNDDDSDDDDDVLEIDEEDDDDDDSDEPSVWLHCSSPIQNPLERRRRSGGRSHFAASQPTTCS